MLITGDRWRVVVDVNVSKILEGVSELRLGLEAIDASLRTVESSNTAPGLNVLHHSIAGAREVVDDMAAAADTLGEMLPSGRRKRGLINGGGKIIKVLFGNPDASDLEDLHQSLNDLDRQSAETIHLQKELTTVTRSLSRQAEAANEEIRRIALDVANVLKPLVRDVERLRVRQEEISSTLHMYINASTSVGNLQFAALKGLLELRNLVVSLQTINVGNGLVASLISPRELSDIVKRVQISLPRGLELVTGTNPADMYIYYSISKVYAHSIGNSVRVCIDLPLVSQGHSFQVYYIKTVPVTDPSSGVAVLFRLQEDVFLLSQNRELHGEMERADLNNCVGKNPVVCPAEFQLYYRRQPTCLSAQYNGDDGNIEKLCQKVVLATTPPPTWEWDAVKSSWYYSLTQPEKLITECRQREGVAVTETTIAHVGVLTATSGCSYRTDKYILFPSTQGVTAVDYQPKLLKVTIDLPHLMPSYLPSGEEETHELIAELTAEGQIHPGPYGAEMSIKSWEAIQQRRSRRAVIQFYSGAGLVVILVVTLVTYFAWKRIKLRKQTVKVTSIQPETDDISLGEKVDPKRKHSVFQLSAKELEQLRAAHGSSQNSAV